MQRTTLRIRAFADDCAYFTKNAKDAEVLSLILQEWEHDSQMSFAPHKSFSIGTRRRILGPDEALRVGQDLEPFIRLGAKGMPKEARYLGWHVGIQQWKTNRASWAETFNKAEARLQHFSKYNFSLPQRTRVLKAMLVSLFTYKTYFLLPTKSEEKRFKSMVLRFLWGKGTHRISWTTLQAPQDKRGLGVLGLGELCECFQAALVGKLLLNDSVHACMRAWVSHSMSEQGLPPLRWGLRD